ncbi:hypothetical protein KA012_02450 [Candidatus Woesebacteria bacterium]|nr:hypothetical protein [Candidatus Woesebacteria bacterium]
MSKIAVKSTLLKIIFLSGLILAMYFGIHYLGIHYLGKNTKNESENQLPAESSQIGCDRTSRLENKPAYDRALSLIQERYKMWEDNGEKIGSWYFFPSQLVNCIHVVDEDLSRDSGLEAYFIFNSKDIKNNYFPVVVDKNYQYSDETVNSLILVHEIIHVYQYLEELKNENQIPCFDKETEAFYAQMQFYSIQYPEARKSIDFRIDNDQDLHPQLQMIKAIKSLELTTFQDLREKCLYGDGKDEKYCIDTFRKNSIREMLKLDDYYKSQCL